VIREEDSRLETIEQTLRMISNYSSDLEWLMMGIIIGKAIYPVEIPEKDLKDKNELETSIVKLQPELDRLNGIKLDFYKEDVLTSFAKKQSYLRLAETHIQSIRRILISIWKMRKYDKMTRYNEIIKNIVKESFQILISIKKDIEIYVNKFNKNSDQKLIFKIEYAIINNSMDYELLMPEVDSEPIGN